MNAEQLAEIRAYLEEEEGWIVYNKARGGYVEQHMADRVRKWHFLNGLVAEVERLQQELDNRTGGRWSADQVELMELRGKQAYADILKADNERLVARVRELETQRKPATVFPPGEYIREEMEVRGWKTTDLANAMGWDLNIGELMGVIMGTRPVTPDTAAALARAFGTGDDVWLNLDRAWQKSVAQANAKAARDGAREEAEYTIIGGPSKVNPDEPALDAAKGAKP